MAQVLIRNLEDALLADYRAAAAHNKRSLEAELREALKAVRPMTAIRRQDLLVRLRAIRAMTPQGVTQTPAEVLVREDRNGTADE
jgi:antitoxin FitA